MSRTNDDLGGRIPLSEPAELTPSQQSLYKVINVHPTGIWSSSRALACGPPRRIDAWKLCYALSQEQNRIAFKLQRTEKSSSLRGIIPRECCGEALASLHGDAHMPPEKILKAKLSTVAYFPPKYFLENLALRQDNSILVTVANRHELWFVPPVKGEETVTPVLLFTFAEVACGITEVEPDIFYVATGSFYTTHEAYLHRLDLRNWNPGAAVHPEMVLQLPPSARGLNGSCLIAPGVLLLADSFASLIWRVDLPPGGGTLRLVSG